MGETHQGDTIMYLKKHSHTIQIILGIFTLCLFLTPPAASAELKLESVYPTLGILNQNLSVTLTGTGFDEHTRVSMFPDVGNRRTIIGAADTPDEAYGLTIADEKAYMAGGESGLLIFDITNPGSPSLISVTDTPGQAYDVAVAGKKAYIADGNMGLQIIDLSRLSEPVISGTVDTPGFARGVAVKENTVLVADGEKGVQIINISDPENPSMVTVDTPAEAYHIAVKGDMAYVADYYGGLQIINIGNPSAPIVGLENTSLNKAYAVTVSGDTAYLADHYNGLHIIDIHDPSAPKYIGSVNTGDRGYSVAVTGTTVFVGGDMGLHLIDVSNVNQPTLKGLVETSDMVHDIMVTENTAYLANGAEGLQIMDVSASVTATGVWDTLGDAYSIVVAGDTAYIADGDRGLQIIDVTTRSAPKPVGNKDTPDFAYGLAIEGNTVYIADGESGLQIISISTPSKPVISGSVNTPGYAQDVVVAGGKAYIADGKKGLQVIDLNTLEIIGSVDTQEMGMAIGVAVTGDTAYLAAGSAGLQTIDVTTPSSPSPLGDVEIPGGMAYDVTVVEKTAYVAAGGAGLQIIDVSTRSEPKIIGYGEADSASDVSVVGNMAYVANGLGGIRVFDVKTPSAPVFIGSMDTTGDAKGITVIGDTVYVANGKRGLLVVPAPVELDSFTLNSEENTLSLALPGPQITTSDPGQIFHYTLRVFNESEAYDLPGAVTFVPADSDIFKAKAIIVAGRKGDSDKIWDETEMLAGKAYDALIHQGYTKERIYYLKADTGSDNTRDVYALATSDALSDLVEKLSREKPPCSGLLIYFVGHGEDRVFRINETETIAAETVNDWLDQLQESISGQVIFIYDACYSGTFISPLTASHPENRIVITSGSDEDVLFSKDGRSSFSYQLWAEVEYGSNLNDAFNFAADEMKEHQTARMDADGDGRPGKPWDKEIASRIYIGRGRIEDVTDLAAIGEVSPAQRLNGNTEAVLWAKDLKVSTNDIQGVFAEIIPPDNDPDSHITLPLEDSDKDGTYQGSHNGFTVRGTYAVKLNVTMKEGYEETRLRSKETTVTQTRGEVKSEPDGYEEDDTFSQANAITIDNDMPQERNFHDAMDVDWVRFFGSAGETYKIEVKNLSAVCDAELEIYDTNGIVCLKQQNNRSAGGDEALYWDCPRESVYYVKVRNVDPNIFGENVSYDLDVYKPVAVNGSGWLKGNVLDADSKKLIGRALITTDDGYDIHTWWTQGEFRWANGRYWIYRKPGTFTVTAEARCYKPSGPFQVEMDDYETVPLDFSLKSDPSCYDFNGDGIVDVGDRQYLFQTHMGEKCGDPEWKDMYDLHTDCKIDILDVAILADHYSSD